MHTKLIFHILAPRPLSSRLGAFFYPKHSPVKKFRNFFYINQSFGADLFSIFSVRKIMSSWANFFLFLWCEKLWGYRALVAPPMGGGVPFCMLSIYQAGFHSLLLPESSITPQCQKGIESGQKVAKVNIYLLDFVSHRENRRQQSAKCKHIFEMQEGKQAERWPAVCLSSCPLGGRWCAPAPSLWVCSAPLPFLCPLSCFAYGALHLNMALFRFLRGFLEGFMVRMYVCMGLGFCVDCGAFVCVSG